MKIITRTLILLAAALVVVGITWGVSSAGLLTAVGSGDNHARPAFSQGSAPPGFMPNTTQEHQEGFRPRGGHGEGRGHHVNNEPSLLGAAEIIKNLILTGIIVALVVLLSRVFGALRGARQQATP
ncbi:hypothetical protein OSCT_1240 [Oscillochloris trichoides DG-6]|uniref:Uncharacterized protein n=1 Tax=Oscillochloris trichoides DG-6 TaxID=765420 RepID=E1ID39_9CHLR|nr:hypothetical protein [Oscillochloris trichoides]EFO80910.1 hypothetical protein OSCT_1240 [Oscillochloris trichoides DG-6]